MNIVSIIKCRIRSLFHKEKLDAQMDDEMRSHIEMQTQENVSAGMKTEEARYAALRQFGWVESIKDTWRKQSFYEDLGCPVEAKEVAAELPSAPGNGNPGQKTDYASKTEI